MCQPSHHAILERFAGLLGGDLDAFHDSLQSVSDWVKWLWYRITGAEGDPEKSPFILREVRCDSV